WGQRVVACVVLRDVVASLSLEALRTDLATRLAGYKHPRRLVALAALPRLGNGKVDRVALRAHLPEGGV
ncbi:MAG: hypothetical protein VKS61_10955, partial [Candidatus Sericytochromatia bacterium]|nr:hypothetical protein [Candidatus Sericytochromatia bacterium]